MIVRFPVTSRSVIAGAVLCATAICVLLDSLVRSPWVATPCGLLLVAVLPGAGLLSASASSRQCARPIELGFWVVMVSLGVDACTGLLLNYVGGISQVHWVIATSSTAAVGSVAAAARGSGGSVMAVRLRWSMLAPRSVPVTVPVWAFAGLLAVLAMGLSVYSASTSAREHFAQLWVQPVPFGAGAFAPRATVGVTNDEGRPAKFLVSIKVGGFAIGPPIEVDLREGQTWTESFDRGSRQVITASLALKSDAGQALSTVKLAVPAG